MAKPKTNRKRSSDQSDPIPSKKRIIQFQADWLRDPNFKDWFSKHPTESQTASCKLCDCSFKFWQKSDITTHSHSEKHKDNVKVKKKSGVYVEVEVKGPSLKERTYKAECATAHFLAVRPVAVSFVNDFVPFLQELTKDVEAVNNMKMKRDKCTNIIVNILYPKAFEKIVNILNCTPYSILVDESTDITNTKVFCVSVQYYSFKLKKSVQHFLAFLNLDPLKGKAPELFASFESYFRENNIDLNNIIGVSCDNASVMTGIHNSFYTSLKAVVPHAILLNCVCHSLALIAKTSNKKLPKDVLKLAGDISRYFCKSPKRSKELSDELELNNLPNTKLLKLSGTRWLEAFHCYDRILSKWPALVNFFKKESDKLKKKKKNLNQVKTSSFVLKFSN
ncbi:hypothetical protein TKK_0002087 [Trichogramma kaykai]